MLQFINSNLGLVTSILSFTAGILGLIAKYADKIRIPPGKWLGKAYVLAMAILILVGLGTFLVWATYKVTYKAPTVAILSPSDSIEATAEGDSVWFSVSGTSSRVVSDDTLMIYVLVYADPEWHVQRPAPVGPDGRWTLTRAWIGDRSAPIHEGSQIRLMAVVSREKRNQDDKVTDHRQLLPVAVSAIVSGTVRTIR